MVAPSSTDILRELARTAGGPVYFEDPQTHARYVAIRQEMFERMTSLPAAEETADEWTDEKNSRRVDLIQKKVYGSVSPAEAAELQVLQAAMLRHRDRVAPLPIEDSEKLLQELQAEAAAQRG